MPKDDWVNLGQQRMALLSMDTGLHLAQRAVSTARRGDESRE